MFKYYGTELNKRRYELMLRSRGPAGPGLGGRGLRARRAARDARLAALARPTRSRAARREIQLNIIAKRVLGLPD